MPSYDIIAIIYNPNSTGDAKQNAQQLKAELAETLQSVKVQLLPTASAGHAEALAYDFAKAHTKPLIVSASGDGGYNEVINGALRAQSEGATPICAVLPSGNANDHARTMQTKPLAELIVSDAVVALDVLKVSIKTQAGEQTERYAHSYLGLGLTPSVAVELNKHTLNSLREAWIVVKTFWNLRPVRIKANNKLLRLDSLICSTIPEMAKVLTLSENSQPHDGLFELTILEHNHRIKLLYRLARGVFKSVGIHSRLESYAFTVLAATPIQVDGEVMKLDKDTTVTVAIGHQLLSTIADV